MKNLILVGGTMGVGKSTTCQLLKQKLYNSVFLDGDWCWDMHPFQVTGETKAMVLKNICFLLNNFIHCDQFGNVIFCWVMHQQAIIDEILARLDVNKCNVLTISLTCRQDVLVKRLTGDIDAGLRSNGIVSSAAARLALYEDLATQKIDTSLLTAGEVADRIAAMINPA